MSGWYGLNNDRLATPRCALLVLWTVLWFTGCVGGDGGTLHPDDSDILEVNDSQGSIDPEIPSGDGPSDLSSDVVSDPGAADQMDRTDDIVPCDTPLDAIDIADVPMEDTVVFPVDIHEAGVLSDLDAAGSAPDGGELPDSGDVEDAPDLPADETLDGSAADVADIASSPVCGDGILEAGEVCDDGNVADGDCCDAACLAEDTGDCGDGVVQVEEDCDDGAHRSHDGCSPHCEGEQRCLGGVLVPEHPCGEDLCLLGCGGIDIWTVGGEGSVAAWDSYGCSLWALEGPELVYLFRSPQDATVRATLGSQTAPLHILVLGSLSAQCDPVQCISAGVETVEFPAQADQDYALVVDVAGDAAPASFSLTLDCDAGGELCASDLDEDGDGWIGCTDPDCLGVAGCGVCSEYEPLACGEQQQVEVGAPDGTGMVRYPCTVDLLGGAEQVFSFTAPDSGYVVVSTASEGDLSEVVLLALAGGPEGLPDCWSGGCLRAVPASEGLSFVTSAGEEMFLAVDSVSGGESLTISLECVSLIEDCANGEDDDLDGQPDCLDLDCVGGAACQGFWPAPQVALACNETAFVSSDLATGVLLEYPGCPGSFPGAELVCALALPPGGAASVNLLPPDPGVTVLLLESGEGPGESACLLSGPGGLTVPPDGPSTDLIVLEFTEPPPLVFALEVTCDGP